MTFEKIIIFFFNLKVLIKVFSGVWIKMENKLLGFPKLLCLFFQKFKSRDRITFLFCI